MKKIMVIDDDTTTLAILRALLDKEYKVTTAKSNVQALGSLQSSPVPPDLILLDRTLVGGSDMELVKSIKTTPRLALIPIIFLVEQMQEDLQLEGHLNGVDDFIQKPVNAELLKLKIRRQFDICELKKENEQLTKKLNKVKAFISAISDQIL